ncbi:MAG TPA: hypothetical protein DHV26_01305, partial [Cytophagales bacterium]|nr:hypothetical protein [Cytophagales bacterium]
ITYSASTGTNTQSWVAPTKFLGSQVTRSLDMNLRFDLQQSHTGTASNPNGDVRIESYNVNLVYSLPTKPALAPAWSSYSLKLDETQGWRINSTAGALATRTQIIAALSNIASIKIRGTYATNASYTSSIDNVVLEQKILLTSPSITSFSPISGNPGASVTLNGSSFDATASNNIVYFGSVAGTITAASTTQLTVTIPTGAQYEKITVINKTTGLARQSEKPFNPTFDGGGKIIPSSFGLPVNLPAGSDYGAANADDFLSVGDVDGDGWADLISTDAGNSITIYRNLGTGGELTTASFAPKFTLTGAGNRVATKTIDLDGDGKLDIATGYYVNDFNTGFATYRNISTPGNLAFEPAERWPGLAYSAILSSVVDVDGDGRADLLGRGTAGSAEVDFWIAQNISTPGNIDFGASRSYFGNAINGVNRIVDADLDNDGKPELIIVSGEINIAKNNSVPGSISFSTPFEIIPGNGQGLYGCVNVADFNLDGKMDLAWKHGFANDDVHIRINTNTGGALAATDFDTEVILDSELMYYGGISIADINGDGKPDIIATDDADVGVFENTYTGGVFDANAFAKAHQLQGISTFTYPKTPVVADLNGDEKPELILYHTGSATDYVSIYENKNIHTPVISLNTVSPLAGPVGSTVTITGNNFSALASENRVWFGGVEAHVISATTTEIKAEVPAGAGYERVSVVRNKLTSYYHLPFSVTFSPGITFDGTSFLPPVTFPLTGADYDVEVADLNGDGKPDIAAESNVSSFNVLSYRNVHTTGAITATSLILDDTTSTIAQDLKILDVDADGKLDIISNGGIYKNSSTTSEISFNAVAGLNNLRFSSWADFNLDGMTDIATININTANLSVHENRYRGYGAFVTGAFPTFGAANNLVKPAINGASLSADFDNDGLADIITTNPGTDNISIWRNTGAYRIATSQFIAVGTINAGDNPGRLYAGDLDVDGKMDFMLYHGTGTNSTLISVFHNQGTTGNIVFNKVDFTIPAAATVAHIRDLDGDGKPDIIVTSESTDQFFILKNTSASGTINASSFAAAFATAVNNPRGLTTGDLNLDGKPEIIITSAPNSLLIFENVIPAVSITITQQPPSSYNACAGTTTSFTTAASGTTNISYQWQKHNGSVFVNLTDNAIYSGSASATLTISNISSAEAGQYRCAISGDLATSVTTTVSNLVVNNLPSPPVVTDASRCGPGSVTLTASGGTPGRYNWYTGSPVTIISDEMNETYVTPEHSTTTAYFVSISDAFCESVRVPVNAVINTPPNAPVVNSTVTPVGNAITACSSTQLVLSAPNGFVEYLWSDGSITQQLTVTASGNYSVSVASLPGCFSGASAILSVTIVPAPCNNSAPVISTSNLSTTLGGSVSIDLTNLISDADNNLVLSS